MTHICTGLAIIRGSTLNTEVETSFRGEGSLYLSIKNSSSIGLSICPFTSNMFFVLPTLFNDGVTYNISGNNIGFLRFGGNNKEGEGELYPLNSVQITCDYFKDRLHLKIMAETTRGSPLYQGGFEEKDRGKLAPTNLSVEFFIQDADFYTFFKQDETVFSPSIELEQFIQRLSEHAPLCDRPRNP